MGSKGSHIYVMADNSSVYSNLSEQENVVPPFKAFKSFHVLTKFFKCSFTHVLGPGPQSEFVTNDFCYRICSLSKKEINPNYIILYIAGMSVPLRAGVGAGFLSNQDAAHQT